MTIFKLKQFASTSIHAATGAIRWNYDRAELIADGVVHGIGILAGGGGAAVLVGRDGVPGRARYPRRLDLCRRLPVDAGAVGNLQSLAGLAHQMGAAAAGPFGDLCADR